MTAIAIVVILAPIGLLLLVWVLGLCRAAHDGDQMFERREDE